MILLENRIVLSQNSLNTTQQNIDNNTGSVCYSIGQFVFNTYEENNGSISQGIQQPYEISITTISNEYDNAYFCISSFPNPTNKYVILKIENMEKFEINELYYTLTDINSNILDKLKLVKNETIVNFESYKASTYFINIFSNNIIIKTFKIIKY